MFQLITPIIYWILIALWLAILFIYLNKLKNLKNASKTIVLLLIIVSIDAFRTVFDGTYSGLFFNSLTGLIPGDIFDFLAQPSLHIVPKILNLIAGILVLFQLFRYSFPRKIQKSEDLKKKFQHTSPTAKLKKEDAERLSLKFEFIFNGIPDAIVFTDHKRRIVATNQGMLKTFGYSNDDLVGKETVILYDSKEEFEHQGRIRFNQSAKEKNEPYEVLYRRKNGQIFIGETLGTIVYGDDGSLLGYLGVIRDVTERKKVEENLKLSASVFTHAREAIAITNATGAIIQVNDTFCNITGYTREEVLGQNPRILKSGIQDKEFYQDMWKSLIEKNYWFGEIINRRKNGELYSELLTISAVRDENNKIKHYVSLFTDISEIKEQQKQLEHIAHYDALTNLPNRVLLAERLQYSMKQSERRKLSLAVAYLDLDGFKAVNDTYGHDVGDELLIEISKRMKEILRDGDTLARLGGDEFIVILVDIERMEDCVPVLSRLLKVSSEPVIIGEITQQVSTSIGVTLYPQDMVEADQLIRHADQAMYIAKQKGKNCFHLFDVHQDAAIQFQRKNIENIEAAFERREFVLYYQPKVNMKTGKIIGAEALIRWQHPEHGLLLPAEFLPVISNHAINIEIGEWVIETVLKQIGRWQKNDLDFPVSVNVCAHQLQQHNFADRLSMLLSKHTDIKPCYLELEILETSALNDMTEVSHIMHACLDLGVSFALDDFGTGFSSLTYLKRLPVNVLKVDQSFVMNMLEDSGDRAIVTGVIGLGAAFNRQVIAEGVETVSQGNQLILMNCELAQGYGIAQPMPANEFALWAADWQPDKSWMH